LVSCVSGAILLPLLLAVAPAHAGGPQLLRVEGAEEGGAPFPPDGGARLSLGKGEPPGLAWGREGRAELPDAVNTTFSTRAGRHRVIGLDSARGEVLDLVGAGVPRRVRVRELAGVDAAGIAHDPDQDALYVLDRHAGAILRVTPLAPGAKRRHVETIPLPEGLPPLGGLAFDPASGHLHVLAPATRELIELDPDGTPIANRVLPAEVGDVQAISFGPSRDTTDAPETTTLFVASATEGGGTTAELSLSAALLAAAPTDVATLLQTVLTSNFDPPSPDPSGLDLINPTQNGPLLISDGEVNEMPLYEGANLFDVATNGALAGTSDTTHFSNEPTGVGINLANNHYFFTDDTGTRGFYEVTAGANQRVDASDPVRLVDLAGIGVNDPEGAAYGGGALFVVDGVNAEVYRLAPGPNGQIDGGGDDVITHFDTAGFGLVDPEGLAYDSDGGHLYVVGEPSDRIAHVTTDGTLLRWLNTAAANARAPAGLAYGPGPAGTRRLYAVDRGVDNNTDPNENDGKLYIFEVVPLGGGGNAAPVVSASVPSSVALGQLASLSGSVNDDGLPTPPQITTTWTKQSGQGSVSFADENQINTTASFTTPGSYRLRLNAFDGALNGFAEATIDVIDPNGPQVFEKRITNGSDDAEEEPTGGRVGLGSSDLELVTDGPNVQTVGLRFTGVAIPAGAAIQNAWIQFQVYEATSVTTNLSIRGELTSNAAPFLTSDGNISLRSDTAAAVNWSPVPWLNTGEQSAAQKTPPLTAIVQEIVSRPGWASGNAMVFTIQGSGERVAEAVDGDPTGAALLHVEYVTGTPPTTTTTTPTTTTTTATAPTTTSTTSPPSTSTTSTTPTTSTSSTTTPTTSTSSTTTTTTLPPTPPIVVIFSPAAGSTFGESALITFTATATDPETGNVSGTLVWSSQKDGVIGTGASFSRSGLSRGKHTITATATDPDGNQGSAQTSLHIRR
jgi:sugar lactone lactonase YvrE